MCMIPNLLPSLSALRKLFPIAATLVPIPRRNGVLQAAVARLHSFHSVVFFPLRFCVHTLP
jgi:hypothetical protein